MIAITASLSLLASEARSNFWMRNLELGEREGQGLVGERETQEEDLCDPSHADWSDVSAGRNRTE